MADPRNARLRVRATDDFGRDHVAWLALDGVADGTATFRPARAGGGVLEGAVTGDWTLRLSVWRNVESQSPEICVRVPAEACAEKTVVTADGALVKYAQGTRVSWADVDDDADGARMRLAISAVKLPAEAL